MCSKHYVLRVEMWSWHRIICLNPSTPFNDSLRLCINLENRNVCHLQRSLKNGNHGRIFVDGISSCLFL